jgi:hypothetical protein
VPWRERLLKLWQRAAPWLDRWVRPFALGLAILLIAAGTAVLVVRLMMLAIRRIPAAAGDWSDRESVPEPPPSALPAKDVETPLERAEHRRGVWAIGLSVGALLILIAAGLVLQTLVHDQRPADFFQPVGARPMPAANLLQGYHWVDQKAGVVQIPIERAMDLLAQRGLPARTAADSQAFSDHGQGGPSDSSGGRSP